MPESSTTPYSSPRCCRPQCTAPIYWQSPRKAYYCVVHYEERYATCMNCQNRRQKRSMEEVTWQENAELGISAPNPARKYYVCIPCTSHFWRYCQNCDTRVIRSIWERLGQYCPTCYLSLSPCRRCGNRTRRPSDVPATERILCASCRQRAPRMVPETTFAKNPFRRYVGFELEFLMSGSIPRIGHLGRLKNDGSIQNEGIQGGKPREFASHAANGDSLLELVREVSNGLRHVHAFANSSCGFHVHLDMRDSTEEGRNKIKAWWIHFEKTIYCFVPASRHTNRFCKSNAASHDGDRYRALNVTAFDKWDSFECRLHHGTINRWRIQNWILFLLYAFDAFEKADGLPPKANFYARTRMVELFAMLKMPLFLRKYLVARARTFAHYNFGKERPRVVQQTGIAGFDSTRPLPPWQLRAYTRAQLAERGVTEARYHLYYVVEDGVVLNVPAGF